MEPILHLSIPVGNLDAARAFYIDMLQCRPGQAGPGGMDVWFYGMQLTLQLRPAELLTDEQQGSRHFGVTLARPDLERVLARLRESPVRWITPVATDREGKLRGKTGAKVADPSGNVIEFKTYDDAATALGAKD